MPHAHGLPPAEARALRPLLLRWFYAERRRLPWRGDAPPYPKVEAGTKRKRGAQPSVATFFGSPAPAEPQRSPPGPPSAVDPYAVWVSEVMLQQTRVETVVAYYVAWMQRFPSVRALARASPEEVNAAWAGLGYYRRARMLHAGAKQISGMDEDGGLPAEGAAQFPEEHSAILRIPGVGAYTAAALASIAFGANVGVVDGNVLRVVARMRGVVATNKSKALAEASRAFMSQLVGEGRPEEVERPGDLNQAIMELGATVCVPSGPPRCEECPVAEHCLSRRADAGAEALEGYDDCGVCDVEALAAWGHEGGWCARLPLREAKKAPTLEVLGVLVARHGRAFLMRRRGEGLLAGQWEFPHVTLRHEGADERAGAAPLHLEKAAERETQRLAEGLGLQGSALRALGRKTHVFSHRRHDMIVFGMEADARCDAEGERAWMDEAAMQRKGLTAGMRKVLKMWAAAASQPAQRREGIS